MTRAAVVMAAAAAGLALAAAAEEAKPSGFDIRLPVVEVVDVADFKVKTYPGRVVPVAQVNIVPQVSGEILEVGFENGSVVKEGDVLYVLDSVKYEAAVKSAEAKVAETKALQQYAERNYARHLKLVDSRAVSQDAVDNSLSARDSARAALAAAQADLAEKRDSLDHCRITAPISGKVGTTQYTRGNYVTTSSGTLVTLVQNAPIRVRFSISNRDYLDLFGASGRRIKEEAVLGLSLANGGEYPDPGEVEYVENAGDEQTDTIMVYALFKNESRMLKPGGTVTVTLTSKKGEMRPAIPATAVLQDVRGPYVWVVGEGGEATRRYIARGDISREWQFVEKGLAAGERVVAEGGHKVRPGMKVEGVSSDKSK